MSLFSGVGVPVHVVVFIYFVFVLLVFRNIIHLAIAFNLFDLMCFFVPCHKKNGLGIIGQGQRVWYVLGRGSLFKQSRGPCFCCCVHLFCLCFVGLSKHNSFGDCF